MRFTPSTESLGGGSTAAAAAADSGSTVAANAANTNGTSRGSLSSSASMTIPTTTIVSFFTTARNSFLIVCLIVAIALQMNFLAPRNVMMFANNIDITDLGGQVPIENRLKDLQKTEGTSSASSTTTAASTTTNLRGLVATVTKSIDSQHLTKDLEDIIDKTINRIMNDNENENNKDKDNDESSGTIDKDGGKMIEDIVDKAVRRALEKITAPPLPVTVTPATPTSGAQEVQVLKTGGGDSPLENENSTSVVVHTSNTTTTSPSPHHPQQAYQQQHLQQSQQVLRYDSTDATVMSMVQGYDLAVHRRFVGSLRKSGFKGNM